MKFLLDTNVLSTVVRDPHGKASIKLLQIGPHLAYISSLTIMEIEYGLSLNPAAKLRVGHALMALLDQLILLPFNAQCARAAAPERARLRKLGTPIGAYDLLIAATALHHNLTLVTHNTREFARIDGLLLEDWQTSS
jgi:tRNA(fMet)-specific endonuclease VapC